MNEYGNFAAYPPAVIDGVFWLLVLVTAILCVYDDYYRKGWFGKLGKFLGCVWVLLQFAGPVMLVVFATGIRDAYDFDGHLRSQILRREAAMKADQAEVNWVQVAVVFALGLMAGLAWLNMADAEDGISQRQARKAAKEAQEAEGDT